MDRRSFLRASGAAGLGAAWGFTGCGPRTVELRGDSAAAPARSRGAFPLSAVGLQLYTVRTLMQQDMERTLAQVSAAGYRIVETAGLYGKTPAEFRAALDRHGLRTVAGHYALDLLEKSPDTVFQTARALGQEYVVVPWLAKEQHASRAAYHALAEQFNRLGERCRGAGLRFAYHNHSFEFENFGSGAPAFDTLIERTNPALVSFELDVYWAYKAAQDPVDYMNRYPGRFALCHIKDGTAPPERAMVDVGKGAIDFAKLFASARRAGLRYAIVEHDQPVDALASIRTGHAALARLLPDG